MTTPRPLSPAAQAVKDAVLSLYQEGPVRDMAWPLECHTAAAAIRALVEQTLPEEICPTWDSSGDDAGIDELLSRMIKRSEILAIAAELDGGAPQHTPKETPND
jgi:hypothetical protein